MTKATGSDVHTPAATCAPSKAASTGARVSPQLESGVQGGQVHANHKVTVWAADSARPTSPRTRTLCHASAGQSCTHVPQTVLGTERAQERVYNSL